MEEKHRERNEEETLLLTAVVNYIGEDVKQCFEEFVDMHGDVFASAHSKDEFPLMAKNSYDKFLCEVDQKVHSAVKKYNGEYGDLMGQCRDSLADMWCPLFEEDCNKWFVKFLLSLTEFEAFQSLVVEEYTMSRKNHRNKK